MKVSVSILFPALAWLLVSCKVGPEYATPASKVASHWSQSLTLTNREFSPGDACWWRYLGDPVLNQFVEAAHRKNLSLQAAGVRVLQARAQLNKSIGNLFPQQQAISAGVNYARLNDGAISTLPGFHSDYASDYALFAATWEMDFWGKYRRGIESDRAAYLGSFASYEDALVTVTADVGVSYVNLCTLEERLRVARRNVELQRESLRLATAQFKAGETSERDVQQATTQLAQTEAQIPKLEESMAQTGDALAVLLGETPEETRQRLTGPRTIPGVPGSVAVGIPRDLLRRRADVRAAGFAAASQSALIGVARANMYPAFSLSGELGFTGNNQGQNSLTDMFTWQGRALNAGAGLLFPVFNYGRLLNQVRVQDAQFQAAVLNYQNTVLVAAQEVENGLATVTGEQRSAALLTNAVTAARRSTRLALRQYQDGQVDYTTVLTAEQAQLAVEDALATTQGNIILGVIAVYRALGGGWAMREGNELISAEVKTEMARRTDWGHLLEPAYYIPGQTSETARTGIPGPPN